MLQPIKDLKPMLLLKQNMSTNIARMFRCRSIPREWTICTLWYLGLSNLQRCKYNFSQFWVYNHFSVILLDIRIVSKKGIAGCFWWKHWMNSYDTSDNPKLLTFFGSETAWKCFLLWIVGFWYHMCGNFRKFLGRKSAHFSPSILPSKFRQLTSNRAISTEN